MSESKNLYQLEDYRVEKNTVEELIDDQAKYNNLLKRFDDLEELIAPSDNLILSKSNQKKPDKTRIYGLVISTIVFGAALCLMFLSFAGTLNIGWQFFASIVFASGGLASACLLILLGVDYEQYE